MSQKFCNSLYRSHNLAAPDAFAEVGKMMNHTELWYAKLAWYSPSATRRICFFLLLFYA